MGREEEQRLRGLPLLASCWWLLLCSRACMTEFETEMEMKEEQAAAAGHGQGTWMGRPKVPLNNEQKICRYWKEFFASRDTLE